MTKARPEGPAAPEPDELASSSGLAAVGELADSIQLVERFRAGDEAALNELFDRYYDRVRRIARIRMGPRLLQLTESDDLVQNTFAVAFKKIGQLDLEGHASIIQYLSRVLENQVRGAVDYFEAQKRTPRGGRVVSVDAPSAGAPIEAVARDPEPLDQLASRELKEIYDACVRSLESTHREVILLREYADASWAEVASALERPTEHAAQQLYARAQIKLATSLRRRLGS